VLEAAVRERAAHVDDSRLAIDVAALEREPLAGPKPAELCRVVGEQPPDDRPRKHLTQRLGRLEPMPGRDPHPPRRDLVRAMLRQPAITERRDRLGEQPAQLLDRARWTRLESRPASRQR
jgi:hypothetical protein